MTDLLVLVAIDPPFLYRSANPDLPTLLTIVAVLAALNGIGGAVVIITLAEIFPAVVRATGESLVYALGVAIFRLRLPQRCSANNSGLRSLSA